VRIDGSIRFDTKRIIEGPLEFLIVSPRLPATRGPQARPSEDRAAEKSNPKTKITSWVKLWAAARQRNQYIVFIDNSGGWGGIRTHGGLPPTAVFKTAALNHSATHPSGQARLIGAGRRGCKRRSDAHSQLTTPFKSSFKRFA
jgi:hypothetical protein